MKTIHHCLKLLIVLAFILMAMDVAAAPVGPDAALARATEFLRTRPGASLRSSYPEMRLAHIERSAADVRQADYYVLNAADGSAFVIVAGDDRATSVLACGDVSLDWDALPCNMRWMLDQYKRQMAFLRDHPAMSINTRAADGNSVTVSPLVSCAWNQRSPYYNQCPTSGTQHCLTGCVATAMAQVMYYWKYPSQVPAMDGYTSELSGIAVGALPGGILDWDNMLDEYTTSATAQQKDAVAMLMRYCGQACHMGYGPSASGAYSDDELEGMKLMGYNADAALLDRDDYTADEWASMIEAQLAAGCPILYGGVDADKNAGHAFVVDGCGGGMYHINWGWSGSGNGYFVLDAFTYNGLKYSSEQQMLYQVYPEGYMYDKHAAVLVDATGVSATGFTATWTDETPAEMVTDYTLYVQPFDPSAHELLLNETFAGVNVNLDATTALSANKIGDYCDNPGWTGSFVYLGAGSCFIVGGQKYVGSLTTPALNVGADGVITVRFSARYFGSDNSSVIVSCGNVQQTIELTRMATEYAVVFDNVGADAKVTFGCTGRASRFYIDDVRIITGDDRDPTEVGAGVEGLLVFPGLTNREHTVTGLTAGATYRYLVVTHYADGVTKKSNLQLVTLLDEQDHSYVAGDVNHDGRLSINDVATLVNYLLNESGDTCLICADVNGDEKISIVDVTALINILLGSVNASL